MNEMTRTDAYDTHLEQIDHLRNQAIDGATLARAYDDYATILTMARTMNSIADHARDDIIAFAHKRANQARKAAKTKAHEADRLQAKGLA